MEPTATVTFLFTDVEGSSRRWEEHPQAMSVALARHDELLRAVCAQHGGTVFKHTGDGICAVFSSAPGAAAAALRAQQSLATEDWGAIGTLPVRMAIHTGTAERRGEDWFGPPLNRTARLLSIIHGGQVITSAATAELLRDHLPPGAAVVDLGEHRLADLARPERAFQLTHPSLPAEFPPLRSTAPQRHNLPPDRTRFVGRQTELRELTSLLDSVRFLTLTGAGGTGKTRLALAAARSMMPAFPDGVFFVELAALADPALVAPHVLSTLGVTAEHGDVGSDAPLSRLVAHLANRRVLLVLDNCEHLLDTVADLTRMLLESCPRTTVLATSQEPLGVPGEHPWRIPSLSMPAGEASEPADVAGSDAVALFCDRARLADPSFVLTSANAALLRRLCHRLDGLPLALELAAARMRAMSLEQISERLDDRFQLLSGGGRGTVPRHRTLRAAMDWSWDLLSESERALLRRLSVCAGTFSLSTVEALGADDVTAADEAVIDVLTSLIDKSLVAVERGGAEVRYSLSETVRQYAEERLIDVGEADAIRDRHLQHFLMFHGRASVSVWSADVEFHYVAADHGNYRAALAWALARGANREALRLAGMLMWYWVLEGAIDEGRAWIERALAASGDAPARVRSPIVAGLAYLVNMQGDVGRASALFEEAMSLADPDGNLGDRSTTMLLRALVTMRLGNISEARRLLDEAQVGFEKLGWPAGVAWCRFQHGWLALIDGDLHAAKDAFEAALNGFAAAPAPDVASAGLEPIAGEDAFPHSQRPDVHLLIGHSRISGAVHAEAALAPVVASLGDLDRAANLAASALAQASRFGRRPVLMALVRAAEMWLVAGRPDQVRRNLVEAVNILLEVGGREWVADVIELSVIVLAAGGASTPAARLLGAAEGLREKQGGFRIMEQRLIDARSNVRAGLGGQRFDGELSRGQILLPEEALRFALEQLTANEPAITL